MLVSYINSIQKENFTFIFKKIGVLLLIFLLAFLMNKLLVRAVRRADKKYEQLDSTVVPVLITLTRTTVFLIALIFILEALGVNASSLVALVGAAGIAVGLALKDTLSHIAAGIMILLLRPFKSGQFIECSSVAGTVKEIGLFSTTLETPDGLYVMAPNSTLWGSPIKNIHRNGKRRMDIVIGISYGDSIDTGFNVLRRIAENETRFLAEPAPQVMVLSMGDSSVNLQLRVWAAIDNYWPVYWETKQTLKEKIEEAGLTIPFPQVDVNRKN